jgi:transposase-like protein
MAPRELFSKPVNGLLCPLCLSGNYTLVAERDTKRGILQTVYLCSDCRSHFGDAREFDARDGDGKP